jgi:hypothetical protein
VRAAEVPEMRLTNLTALTDGSGRMPEDHGPWDKALAGLSDH